MKRVLVEDREMFRMFSMSKHLFRNFTCCWFRVYLLSLSYCFPIFTAVSVHRPHIDDNNAKAFVAFRFGCLQSIRNESVCDCFVCAINETVSTTVACFLFVFKCVRPFCFLRLCGAHFCHFSFNTRCVLLCMQRKKKPKLYSKIDNYPNGIFTKISDN